MAMQGTRLIGHMNLLFLLPSALKRITDGLNFNRSKLVNRTRAKKDANPFFRQELNAMMRILTEAHYLVS